MIAIETKVLPVTDHRPTRIKAYTVNGQRLVMSKSAAEDASPDKGNHDEDTHRVVAQALADSMGWTGKLVGGATVAGYAFCFAVQS